ncbi:hypothetical protein HM131_19795 [Halobacillus mangrovi]|uniref:Uncharacterized protein n=1 Tax=Halobacillus mangrovi TaxID=402384 RepID=A0A1W6A0C1_9BACI|nr:hypothetical protein HM131_19795 [Halobacillus mangrovi]
MAGKIPQVDKPRKLAVIPAESERFPRLPFLVLVNGKSLQNYIELKFSDKEALPRKTNNKINTV